MTLALPSFHSFRNSFHSATPWALRMRADTGSSFGARGALSSFRPASCGRRLPLRVFTCLLDHTRFSHVSGPPRDRGHDVVQAALVRTQQRAGVLAAVAVALADRAGAQLRALLRHPGEVHGHDDRRHADRAAHRAHCVVAVADGKRDPFVPGSPGGVLAHGHHHPARFRARWQHSSPSGKRPPAACEC